MSKLQGHVYRSLDRVPPTSAKCFQPMDAPEMLPRVGSGTLAVLPWGRRPFLMRGPRLFAFWVVLTNTRLGRGYLLLPRGRGAWARGEPRPPPEPPAPTWRCAGPQSPRRDSARPAPSSPLPRGGRAPRDSSPGPCGCSGGCGSGGSPVSKPRPSRSAPPGALMSPPSRRLLGEAEGSVIAPESILRFRGSSGTPRDCPG